MVKVRKKTESYAAVVKELVTINHRMSDQFMQVSERITELEADKANEARTKSILWFSEVVPAEIKTKIEKAIRDLNLDGWVEIVDGCKPPQILTI